MVVLRSCDTAVTMIALQICQYFLVLPSRIVLMGVDNTGRPPPGPHGYFTPNAFMPPPQELPGSIPVPSPSPNMAYHQYTTQYPPPAENQQSLNPEDYGLGSSTSQWPLSHSLPVPVIERLTLSQLLANPVFRDIYDARNRAEAEVKLLKYIHSYPELPRILIL